jgi:hypothetical protein
MRALLRDVRNVDHRLPGTVHIEYLTAGTFLEAAARFARFPFVRRQPLPRVPQRVFPRGPISLITPRLKISRGAFRQKHQPGALKIGAGLVEGGGRAILLLARVRSRIETTMPLPRILIVGIAGADRDRASVHVPVVDVPAFLAGVSRSAAVRVGMPDKARWALLGKLSWPRLSEQNLRIDKWSVCRVRPPSGVAAS